MIREWYNGYSMDWLRIYNPWSIANCLEFKLAKACWLFSGNNQLVKNQIQMIVDNKQIASDLKKLLSGEEITLSCLKNYVKYENEYDFEWNQAFFAGYLAISKIPNLSDDDNFYSLKIPNNEIKQAFKETMIESLSKSLNLPLNQCKEFLPNLLKGNIEEFYKTLSSYVMAATSNYRAWKENSYQKMLYDLLWIAKETHYIDPDDETGHGRSDLILTPKPISIYTKGIIIEIKVSKKEKDDLTKYSKKALDQIFEKSYDTKLKEVDYIKEILYIGMGFFKNKVHIKYGISRKDSNSSWSPIEFIPIDDNNEKKTVNNSILKTKIHSKSKNIKSCKDFDPIKMKKEVTDSLINGENLENN